MNLRKSLAFLIALSMLVGLVFTTPVMALTPVEGYAETVLVDETFDKNVSDKLTVFNGNVEDGVLSFELSAKSYVAYNEGLDTKNLKQHIIEFDLTTDKEYSDPWTATFVGIRSNVAGVSPEVNENGAWVGITADKVIYWFSHRLIKWGEGEEGVDYLVFDAPTDLSSASYKVIYEGNAVEMYADDTLIAAFSIVDSYAVLACGDNSLTSAVKFADTQTYRYFTIYNEIDDEVAGDPLAPQDPEEYLPSEDLVEDPEDPGEGGVEEDVDMSAFAIEEVEEIELFAVELDYSTITVDNFKVVCYKDLLASEATIESLEAKKAELEAVIDTYYTDDTADDIYLPNSVVVRDVEAAVAKIENTLAKEELLESEATETLSAVSGVLSNAVAVETAESYPAKFTNFENLIEDLLADDESGFSESTLLAVLDKIEAAKAVVYEDGVTNGKLDSAYNTVLQAIAALNVYTEDGIPAYTQSFTGDVSLAQFEKDWYHTGSSHQTVPVTTEKGIPINLWGAMAGQTGTRYKMDFRTSYPVYSVQATLTREATGKMMFGIRQTVSSDTYEQDYLSPVMIGYQGVSIQEAGAANNLENIYIVIKDGTYKASEESMRVATKIKLSDLDGVLSEDKKTFTPLIKDFGEIIEFYAVNDDGENVALAKIVFDAVVTKVSARGTLVDGYSSGTLYNLVTGEVIPFNGMCVQLAKNSVIGFSSRSGRYFVKDFQINTNILPAEEVLVYDGSTDPNTLVFETEKDEITVGEATNFTVVADFDSLKIAGKNEYKAGSIDVKAAPAVEITTTLGDEIVTVDAMSGTITGVTRGSEIVTATYTKKNGEKVAEKALITVNDEVYTAPTEADAFDGRIVAANFANAAVFKSIEVGTELVPVIGYEYPNGETGILPSGCYVKYFTEDDDIVAYDEAKGAYVAVAEGYTKLFAEVYMTTSTEPVTTAKANVEVAAVGEATLGAGSTVAAMDLIDAANNASLTTEEKKAVIDAAIADEIAISYEDDLDVELIMAAIASVSEDDELSNMEIIATAVKNAKAVKLVYNVVADENTTSDDLADLLFGEDGINKELDIPKKSVNKYLNLTNTKASRVMTRLFAQLDKQATDLTAAYIAESLETILESVSDGGGSGKGGITITTDKNNGDIGFVAATVTKPVEPAKVVITAEQINAAAAKFSDADEAAWAKDAIGTLVHKGVISGYEDGTMRPNGVITRDEFVKLLVVAFELETKANAYNYFWADVPANGWQVPYIAAAHEANILSGTNGGAFGSNVRITREDMASMIYKAVQMKKATLPSDKMVAFTDAGNITDYALEAVNKLAAAGVISGMGDGTFAPGAGATRAQAFQMIYLILELV